MKVIKQYIWGLEELCEDMYSKEPSPTFLRNISPVTYDHRNLLPAQHHNIQEYFDVFVKAFKEGLKASQQQLSQYSQLYQGGKLKIIQDTLFGYYLFKLFGENEIKTSHKGFSECCYPHQAAFLCSVTPCFQLYRGPPCTNATAVLPSTLPTHVLAGG